MTRIEFPLTFGMRHANVADLQLALAQILAAEAERLETVEREALEQIQRRSHEEGHFGETTRTLVCGFQRLYRLSPSGEVDCDTAELINRALSRAEGSLPYGSVAGTVGHADGSPVVGVKVVAFDRDLRSEQLLGEAPTDKDGNYRIRYDDARYLAAETGSADLVVRVFAADGRVLAASGTVFNAPRQAQIDVVVPAGVRRPPSLFEKIAAAIAPVLDDVAVAELDETPEHQDLSFLSGETGFARPVLARFVVAHRLACKELPAQFWFGLLGAALFAYDETSSLRQQLPALLDGLSGVDTASARKSLGRSFADNDIPLELQGETDNWIKEFLATMARHVVDGSGKASFARQALDHAGIADPQKQQRFAALFNQYKALSPELLRALENDTSFSTTEIADLRTSYRLGELTQGDFSVVKALKDDFDVREPARIRGLARQSPEQWTAFVTRKAEAGDIHVPIQLDERAARTGIASPAVYAHALERRFRETYPTAAFLGGLDRAAAGGTAKGIGHVEQLRGLLDRHDDFELLSTPIDAFLANGVHPSLREAAKDEGFRTELKKVQRVFKVAPTFQATDVLLADGVHSAQAMYRMGRREFVETYADKAGMTRTEVQVAWGKAADTHAAVLTIVGDLKAFETEGLPLALHYGSDPGSTFPNWNNLFQSGDLCECEQCRSVLSPAAYFADLLMFLRDRKAANPAFSVKDILFARRPDLGFIELDCENAMTPLPYVDVVCEVLEKVIAGNDADRELAGFTAMPADPVAAKAAALAAFNALAPKVDLGADFTLSQIKPADPNRWVVHGDDVTYLLKKKATPNFFAEVLPNTKADADELRAYPAYVNAGAYEILRHAVYPMVLPFDLFGDEVRSAFRKCNLDRWDLMRTLHGAAAPNDATDGQIAAEYFAISVDPAVTPDERQIILVAAPANADQQAAWGETGNAGWLAKISVVKAFLDKTGLTYQELLALLDLKFINPAVDIGIRHLDASCDLDQKLVENLDAAKLDRINRFLRLWRKLDGWKPYELDGVIRHPAIGGGHIDEPFLIKLFHFGRLKSRLGPRASIEQLCALFGNIGTETHFNGLYKKRIDGFYQGLFLNKRHVQPLDPALVVAAVDVAPPTAEKISGHVQAVLGALGVRQADLDTLTGLTRASDGKLYITDDLTLANLSFIWRHAWLAKQLKIKPADWKTVLKLFDKDIAVFAGPQAAIDFIEDVDRLVASGFKPGDLDWLLAANPAAPPVPKQFDTARILSDLRKGLQAVKAEYDPAQYPSLSPPSDPDGQGTLLVALLQKLRRDEIGAQFFLATLQDSVVMTLPVPGIPAGFSFPAPIGDAIAYDEASSTIRFTGLMTTAQRTTLLGDPALAAVTGIAAYQQAIAEFFERPRLALKFFRPEFTAPLATLPQAADFATLSDPALRAKIGYDADSRRLTLEGILTPDDKQALDALSNDASYLNAVNSLYTQPRIGVFPPEQIWLTDAELTFPLRDLATPANDHLAANLARAITAALVYFTRTEAENFVVQQAAAKFGLDESLARTLLTQFKILPDTLLAHLTQTFAPTAGAIDDVTFKPTFDGWYWASRVATLCKAWKLTSDDFGRLVAVTAGAQLIDPLALPLDSTKPIAPLDRFLRTVRLMRMRDALPETGITLLEVLVKLNGGNYAAAADFAADVALLNDAWAAADVADLIAALDVAYPAGYLLAETWERLRKAFAFCDGLNARPAAAKAFAAATMSDAEARSLKNLLLAKFGAETWFTLSGEIQDALRERKRGALGAYILTLPMPADAPSGKWEETNDLYAYYLLDVEMCSCQLTSRLVQGSGSVQLFVQRCFMGLEPKVRIDSDGDDGDSAWRWWSWMRKYRVWEANRRVFLWPENWIEPELKKDRSTFFKDLESDLQQNEINTDSAEKAYLSYLEKLDGVAQLEIAGFFQEDDGDDAILHVFGRTIGTDPHIYYYRNFDYRQWSPWEKVDLDIQGDYLVPAVVAKRLYLFWPVFTEVQDEDGNSKVSTPGLNQPDVPIKQTMKKLQLQMAVSDYRQGKWTPRRISRDRDVSQTYSGELLRKNYRFYVVDRSEMDGRFGVKYAGYSEVRGQSQVAALSGAFEITGCAGVPVRASIPGSFTFAVRPEWNSTGDDTAFLKWQELDSRHDSPENDLALTFGGAAINDALQNVQLLLQTPWIFKISPAWHQSYLDRLLSRGNLVLPMFDKSPFEAIGSWLPFFYNDKKRTFFVLPTLASAAHDGAKAEDSTGLMYYPEVKKGFKTLRDALDGYIQTGIDAWDLSTLSATDRQNDELFLNMEIPSDVAPPYTDEQFKAQMTRYLTLWADYFLGVTAIWLFQFRQYEFRNFYHPFICDFLKRVYDPLQGVDGLMRREVQLQDSGFSFKQSYQPTLWVDDYPGGKLYPRENVDFAPQGAYASYNWEVFFHAPLLIANALSQNQRFEEARDWYHYIFNPVGVESPTPGGSPMSKYWITKPFYQTTDATYVAQRIENIMTMLSADVVAHPELAQARTDLEGQVLDWRNNPFEPHRIANYRTVAYQKTVIMKYLDNLIAWGDYLFAQDSMESINEATQIYVLAAEILGPKPKQIPPQAKPPVESYNELEDHLDSFANALVQVENLVPPMPGKGPSGPQSPPLPMLYFCIPHNDKMLGYWDTVADRLYKIRHCMNIEGVVRQLALFEPPIDPGALVKAVAGGVDIGSALADLNAPLPLYRFSVMLQKANEVCADVKALGGALLGALEKRDAEALALLRQKHELRLLDAVKALRQQQLDEAKEMLNGIKLGREVTGFKKQYYAGREFMNTAETVALALNTASTVIDAGIAIGYSLAGGLKLIPDFVLGASGFGGSPHAVVETGGKSFGDSAEDLVRTLESVAHALDKMANISSTLGSYQRRQDEWNFQRDLADKELAQIDSQIAAAELRIAIAQKELDNQVVQIEDAKAVDDFMHSKYTNQDLYQWQIGQVSGVYFKSYKLAYDLAKRAERCFRFELGLQDSSYINFGYWDSLKKGLLSGEQLQFDLRRLEAAYIGQNKRELELTKHASLALLDPLALVTLRETGRCFLRLPEEIFDLDYPGHYFRRIKSVSLTLPCVTGPYTTISCTLRLTRNSIRINTANGDNGYPRNTDDNGMPADDTRFIENNIPVKAIAASSGQNDSGVFELNFRDERYLPFEGAGAISDWSIELFNDAGNPDFGRTLRQFDYGTISDAILHVKYAAREDAGPFKAGAIQNLRDRFAEADATPAVQTFNLRRDFPSAWARFLNPTDPAAGNVFELAMSTDRFRFLDAGKTLKINAITLFARGTDAGDYKAVMTPPLAEPPPADSNVVTLGVSDTFGGLHFSTLDVSGAGIEIAPGDSVTWKLKMTRPGGGDLQQDPVTNAKEIGDLIMVLGYAWA